MFIVIWAFKAAVLMLIMDFPGAINKHANTNNLLFYKFYKAIVYLKCKKKDFTKTSLAKKLLTL